MNEEQGYGLGLSGLSNSEALNVIAELIDRAVDEEEPTLVDLAFRIGEEVEKRELAPEEAVLLDYFLANAWACRFKERCSERESLWDFEQPEIQSQIFLLRRAVHSVGFDKIEPIRQCQILTNLGNQLDTLGRFIEARACWSSATEIDSRFWMARANRGRGLMNYAAALYDNGHHRVFAYYAHSDLAEAVELISKYPQLGDARLDQYFDNCRREISERYDLPEIESSYRPDGWSLGDTQAEQEYRRWCLKNILFLNPLNDIGADSIAARDAMNLPSFTLPAGEPPIFTGMFNELKQLFASARWHLWEGVNTNEMHFSDNGVHLFNTLDYPSYGLSVEKIKIAFRSAYSVFDKVAYFLNFYFALGVPDNRVSFRTIWRNKDGGSVREIFSKSENWPLRGLYWLSKDLFDKDVKDSMEPEARALADLRNHLEHKYVKVHESFMQDFGGSDLFKDTHAYSITCFDLERKSLRLLQLARSAMVYLSLAMHYEERRRAKNGSGMVASISLDEWKGI